LGLEPIVLFVITANFADIFCCQRITKKIMNMQKQQNMIK